MLHFLTPLQLSARCYVNVELIHFIYFFSDVDLGVFANFNKLIALTTDTSRIAKALQRSTVLKVSENGTKVCRLTPVNKKENIDECTVYVRNLPPDSDRDCG